MNKPTIPNEVADVIESLREKQGYSNASIVDLALLTGGELTKRLQAIPFDTLMAALVNGYEREMTDEERRDAMIRQRYIDNKSGCGRFRTSDEDHAHADGIRFALDTLGIQIEGVNV